MAATTYPIAIPSLTNTLPALSENTEFQMVNEGKNVGDPFDVNAVHSKYIGAAL